MTVNRHIWVGTGATEGPDHESIWRIQRPTAQEGWDTVPVVRAIDSAQPAYLTLHPAADRLYAVAEQGHGKVKSFDIGSDSACQLGHLRSVESGGSSPCHLRVHPQGRWLYVANYGDGTLAAIELTEAGDVSDNVLTFTHSGSGPVTARQQGSHAHATRISPGGGYLLVSDLGTDEIRAYPLESGRPLDEPVLTTLPPGSGPRHFAGKGRFLYVSAELSGLVLVLAWDEERGQAELAQELPTGELPGRSEDARWLSHLMYTRGVVLVASRGTDTISTFAVHDEGARLELLGEVETATWPRHMAMVGDDLVVAGERADAVVVHPFSAERAADGENPVGQIEHRLPIPRPMFILPM